MLLCHNARCCILYTSLLLFIPLTPLHSQSFLAADSHVAKAMRQKVNSWTNISASLFAASRVSRKKIALMTRITCSFESNSRPSPRAPCQTCQREILRCCIFRWTKPEKKLKPSARLRIQPCMLKMQIQNTSSLSCILVAIKPQAAPC